MQEDLAMLRRVVQEPVRQMILADVGSPSQARALAQQVRHWSGAARPVVEVFFDANKDDPGALMHLCQAAVETWDSSDDSPGLLLICDASPPEARNDTTARFWRGMNLLRERWDALPAQTIFLITPAQYRLFTTEADHLKRWITLKLDLRGAGEPAVQWRSGTKSSHPAGAIEWLSDSVWRDDLEDKEAARRNQEALRDQLREALERGEPIESLASRYYLPLLAAAITLHRPDDAAPLNARISQCRLTTDDRLRWLRLRARLAETTDQASQAIETAREWLALARQDGDQWDVLSALWDLIEFHERRKNLDEVEKCYMEALEIAPKDTAFLGNYATFFWQMRHDYERAEEFYHRAIEADPRHANILGAYATFVWHVRHDYERAEEFYRRAIDADPNQVNALSNYAVFLHHIRHDYERAEEFYRRAVEADPNHVINLGNYANFLWQVHQDYERAEAFYRGVIEVEPNDASNLGNYAQLLLSQGRRDQGEAMLARAEAGSDSNPPLQAELAFYRYAHFPENAPAALNKLKEVLTAGGRSPGWNLEPNIARARQDGHPNVPLLEALAAVITGSESIDSLQAFPEWQAAAVRSSYMETEAAASPVSPNP